jgi:hypothetical protein
LHLCHILQRSSQLRRCATPLLQEPLSAPQGGEGGGPSRSGGGRG